MRRAAVTRVLRAAAGCACALLAYAAARTMPLPAGAAAGALLAGIAMYLVQSAVSAPRRRDGESGQDQRGLD
jgi:hypothetical protein